MGHVAAIDHHVLAGYVSGIGSHREALKALVKRGYELVISPTVLGELELTQDQSGGLREVYGLEMITAVTDGPFAIYFVQDSEVEAIASNVERLAASGVFPGARIGDLFVLAEAAHAKCEKLVTTCPYLTDADPSKVEAVLRENGLHPVKIRQSRQIRGEHD